MLYEKQEIFDASEAAAAEMVRHNMENSQKWLGRGLIAIYRNQTADEQTAEQTKVHNGIGFTGADAQFLTSVAKQYLRRTLSDKQWAAIRKAMPKYARQLARIARSNQPPKQESRFDDDEGEAEWELAANGLSNVP